MTLQASEIVLRPVISEKSMLQTSARKYTFAVADTANKLQIKGAVEAAYGVSVTAVRTMNYRPDRRTRYTKTGIQHGKTNAYKKAIVDVEDGDVIDFYSNL